MSLTLPEVTRIADAVAREQGSAFSVLSVASSDAETERVELLVTVAGCHREPCTFLLNLSRGERIRFEEELRIQLRAALVEHSKTSAP